MNPGEEETRVADSQRILRVIHLLSVSALKPVNEMRILDLACRVGAFATPLSEIGAEVVGVEGRQENINWAPPSDVKYINADVRTVTRAAYGEFDATLCLGLLYHLDADDAVQLLRAIYSMTTNVLILDTHVSMHGTATTDVNGNQYTGHVYQDVDTPWGSLGNKQSWWFTVNALEQVLRDVGFRVVERITGRGWHNESPDRAWWVAYK